MRPILRTTTAIARVTFTELLRDRVLYGALVICGLLLVLGALVSGLSFVRPERILLDYGILALAVSSAFLGVLGGAVVLAREFDRRTVFIALARPISRLEFLVGKYLGLASVLLLNSLFVSVGFLVMLWMLSSDWTLMGPTLFQALALVSVQGLVLAAFSLFFSSFSTPSLSIIMALGLYLVGVNVSQVRLLLASQEAGALRSVLEALVSVLPNFEHFNLGFKVSYGLQVPASFVATSLLYAAVWTTLLLGVSGWLLERKEA